ncbi:SAG family member [Eimeria mitis]|uniref:SAG family member n=1 Tax=Eimeria mitis TaxID=44415 RepID=U6KAM0_9EIME|nr:SAG family member [Eimeria mitis]CDJ32533.1 SAG family member [Eimeria mitis]
MRNRRPFPQEKACASMSAMGVQDKHICIRVLRAHCFGVNVPSPCFVFDYRDNHTVTMAPLKLLTVVSSSLLFLAKANGEAPSEQPTYTLDLGDEGKCLDEVNAARVAAGLDRNSIMRTPGAGRLKAAEANNKTKTKSRSTRNSDVTEFQSGTYAYLPIDDPSSVDCKAVVDKWKEAYTNFDGLPPAKKKEENFYDNQENVSFVALYNPTEKATADCRTKTKSRSTRTSDVTKFQSGTYAYLPIDDPNSVDCKAVVDKWKEAYSNFDGLPPANKEGDNLYDNQENVSFVALYNPTEKATADCRVVTCTKTTPATSSFKAARSDGSTTETGSALICMTVPDVLEEGGKAPFSEEQWEQIVTALEGSASAVAPGVVGFALAIVGLTML